MSESGLSVKGEGALGDYCPLDGSKMTVVREEGHVSYGGGYYLYFLECEEGHRWLRVITQYDEAPSTLLFGWNIRGLSCYCL